MFGHIFKNRFKCIIGDKAIVFWSILFPIILATFFNLSIANITKSEGIKSIPIAIIKSDNELTKIFLGVTKAVKEDEKQFFDVTYTDKETADKLLDEESISAVIEIEKDIPILTVRTTGIKESIIKSYIDGFIQNQKMIQTVMTESSEIVSEETRLIKLNEVMEVMKTNQTYTEEFNIGKNKPDVVLNYFYSLIGMACLYGSFFGMKEVISIQGNLSAEAVRLNLAPVSKLKQFLAGYAAAYCIQIVGLFILLAYLAFGIKIEFGEELPRVILIVLIGSAMSIAIGGAVGGIGAMKEDTKMGMLIAFTMVGSALTGLMFAGVRYYISSECPILMYINPVALITNSFYALYYYEDYTKYTINIACMLIFMVVFILATYKMVRRKQYASI